jgi:ribosomal protein S18 acetylase RimI-like enzyme
VIRSAGVGDLEGLYELEVACFEDRRFTREHLLYLLRNPRASAFVYEDGRVLGSIMVHDEGGVLRVLSVGVHPSFRRRGVGRRLMGLAEDVARQFGSHEVRLEVSTKNQGAVAFYEALGYETAGRLSRYYSWGDDAFAMRKPVAIEVRKP